MPHEVEGWSEHLQATRCGEKIKKDLRVAADREKLEAVQLELLGVPLLFVDS
jgi:hypothetical protein